MLFLGKKKKKTSAKSAKPKRETLWSLTYTQSSSFKGFRKIRLSRYYDEAVDKTIYKLKKQSYNMDNRKIRLECIQSNEQYNKYKVIQVYVDNMLIGSVFNSDKEIFSMLTDYEIDKVHVRIEDSCPDEFIDNVVTARAYLMVHYPADAPLKIDTIVE